MTASIQRVFGPVRGGQQRSGASKNVELNGVVQIRHGLGHGLGGKTRPAWGVDTGLKDTRMSRIRCPQLGDESLRKVPPNR